MNRMIQEGMPGLTRLLGLCLVFFLFIGSALAAGIELGTPPTAPTDLAGLRLSPQEKVEADSLWVLQALPPVNPNDRNASRNFYNNYFLASGSPLIAWTGNRAACSAGTTAPDYKDAVASRINYYRAMAGVPSLIVFSDIYSGKDQKTALMMSANNQLSHYPPADWTCYSAEGAEGAQSSNLALGAVGWSSISLYIQDPGSNNGAVGHRRWILYPQTQQMGSGDIPPDGGAAANALWVFDANIWNPRPTTREEYVAWPPPGYAPYQVVYPRWSFSYPQADFSQAAVTMTENQQPIITALEAVHNGYGENTLVWTPKGMSSWESWPKPAADTRYRVTISNFLVEGNPRNVTYDVIVFDPATAPPVVSKPNPALMLLLD